MLVVIYRKDTKFDKYKFIDEISFNLPKHKLQELALEAFISMFKTAFEKHAPLKKKYIRANHFKFITKELSKATILKSKLRKKVLER